MAKLNIVKKLDGWYPIGDDSIKYHKKGKLAEIYYLDVKKYRDQRNAKLNAKYWVMLQVAVDNSDKYRTTEQLHIIIKKVLGIIEEIWNPITKEMDIVVGSTNFVKMENDKFNAYYSDALNVVLEHVLSGTTEQDMNNAIQQILGFT